MFPNNKTVKFSIPRTDCFTNIDWASEQNQTQCGKPKINMTVRIIVGFISLPILGYKTLESFSLFHLDDLSLLLQKLFIELK